MSSPSSTSAPAEAAWRAWATHPDQRRLLAELDTVSAAPSVELVVDDTALGQTWLGVGAAMTDASVVLLAEAGPGLLDALFDPDHPSGAQANLVRLPLSATDFSTRFWTWWDDPEGTPAPTIEAADALDAVRAVVSRNPDTRVIASAWSAPAWMKDSATVTGGALEDDAGAAYSNLLVAQTRWLAPRVPLHALSVVNEPGHSSDTYPTMTMTDDQLIDVARRIRPAVRDEGVELWALDHNWNERERLDALLAGGAGLFDVAAFHCYGGSPQAMAGLPVPSAVTECTGGEWDTSWASTFTWQLRNLVVEPVRAGSTALLLWNLALDPDHGPATGGCQDCRGVVTVDPATRRWTPQPEFFLLGHVARAASPGARRVELSERADVPAVAFANDDGTVGVVGQNAGRARQVIDLADATGRSLVRFEVDPGELFSVRGPAAPSEPQP
ncbi:MAG: glycoside hydrolase family 30 protein [Actinobacteria bacterium]|nr:glycoside hydrolase family 30 protein [Actinomycetota bacterium]